MFILALHLHEDSNEVKYASAVAMLNPSIRVPLMLALWSYARGGAFV